MILIAIGSNLPAASGGGQRDNCRSAVDKLSKLVDLSVVAVSDWYRTSPLPRADQPDYCNGVVRFEGQVEPEGLLAKLHAIEAEFGRVRTVPNAARTLDLDIIDLNGLVLTTESLVLPHPRAHLRGFVLRPILDVAPAWRHPVLQQNVATLLAELPPQGVRPWCDAGA